MLSGSDLRELLGEPDPTNRAVVLENASDRQISEALSHLLTNYDFNAWQYDLISEACERLDHVADFDKLEDL